MRTQPVTFDRACPLIFQTYSLDARIGRPTRQTDDQVDEEWTRNPACDIRPSLPTNVSDGCHNGPYGQANDIHQQYSPSIRPPEKNLPLPKLVISNSKASLLRTRPEHDMKSLMILRGQNTT